MFQEFVKGAASRILAGRVPLFVLSGPEGHGGSLLAMQLRPVIRRLSARPVLVLPVPSLRDMVIEDDNLVVAAVLRYRSRPDKACWEIDVLEPVDDKYVQRFQTRVPHTLLEAEHD